MLEISVRLLGCRVPAELRLAVALDGWPQGFDALEGERGGDHPRGRFWCPWICGMVSSAPNRFASRVPVRLMPMTRFHDSSVILLNGSTLVTPALVTRIPTGPNSPRARSTARSTSARFCLLYTSP